MEGSRPVADEITALLVQWRSGGREALDRLIFDRDLGRLVELRFFGGMTVEQTAEALDRSPATV